MLLVHLHPVLLRDVPKHVLLLIKLQQVLSYACLCMLTDGLERFLYCTSVHCTQYRYSVLYTVPVQCTVQYRYSVLYNTGSRSCELVCVW